MSRAVLKTVLLRLALLTLLALPFAACDLLKSDTDTDKTSGTDTTGTDTTGTDTTGIDTTRTGSTAPADTTVPNVTWFSHAVQFRGDTNLRVAYNCPDSGTANTVWGSDVYTDDSSVCTAGVHAGKITFASGGRVVIEIRPGRNSYDSLTRNGVTTWTYGQWGGSYIFP